MSHGAGPGGVGQNGHHDGCTGTAEFERVLEGHVIMIALQGSRAADGRRRRWRDTEVGEVAVAT